MDRYKETLELTGTDPVAGWDRRLQVVVSPTGEAARFFRGDVGRGVGLDHSHGGREQ